MHNYDYELLGVVINQLEALKTSIIPQIAIDINTLKGDEHVLDHMTNELGLTNLDFVDSSEDLCSRIKDMQDKIQKGIDEAKAIEKDYSDPNDYKDYFQDFTGAAAGADVAIGDTKVEDALFDEELLRTKLKGLNFSDSEIDDIINGKTEVDKVELDELVKSLEETYTKNKDIKKLILEKYGVDVFNDDGTVIRDLAAIVLIMDGKNPDDDFDVKKLIADLTKPNETPVVDENKETNSEEENVVSQETTNNDKETEIPSDTTTHSGNSVSSTTLSDETITGTDEYKEAVNEIQEIIYDDNSSDVDLTDASDNIKRGVTSVLRGKIPSVINPSEHQDSTSVKSATAGVGSALAGLATAAAISGGGITAVKKHENNKENKEEKTNHVYNNTSSPANEVKEETISTRPKWLDELDI